MKAKILVFAGSARKDSFNKKLAQVAASEVKAAGGEATLIDLADYPLPLYDGDLEARDGQPENARKLKKLMIEHQGLLISSPEYNSSISPLLKNVIDWASRAEGNEGPLAAYQGKVAGLISASPGALGGLRGLVHLRAILGNINVLVVPNQFALSSAGDAFAPDGSLKEARATQAVKTVATVLVQTVQKLMRE